MKPKKNKKAHVGAPGRDKASTARKAAITPTGAKITPEARKWRNRITGHGEVEAKSLLANPKNWRIHPKNQVDALAGVLSEVGWVQDVIVNQRSGFVVDGHARVALAIKAGEKVPVVYVELDEREEEIILATLDPLSAMAEKDEKLLQELAGSLVVGDDALKALVLDLAGTKVTAGGLTEPDACPEVQPEPVTAPGDLWIMGPHRLLCGDSTSVDAVELLMNEIPIVKHLKAGEIAYEPFAGSGPQFIAAEKQGRRCFGLELEPRYCDVIVRRWQQFTGKQAVLDGDSVGGGRTFDELAAERKPQAVTA